jgi:hypothetical protein
MEALVAALVAAEEMVVQQIQEIKVQKQVDDAASASAAAGGSGSSGTDTGDMGSESANNAATDAANASVGMGSGPTDTGDLGSEAANDAATAAGAASVGMGTLSSYSRPGMVATNISNYMRGNPMTSLGLTALGTMIGVPALGVMNAVNSVYGGGSSGSSTGSGQGEDGSGDGGDGRTPISSFDSALLTPDLLDSYNLAKNRDYRLFQSSNNPFYSLQRNPSGGISNVYTEFKKGGRVGFAEGGSMSKGLDYLSGVERRGYQEGSVSQEGVIPGFEKIRDTVYFNSDGTPNLEKIKAANFLAGSSPSEFGYRDIKTGDVYGPSTYTDIASGRYPNIYDPSKNTQTSTPTEDFSDYLNQSTDATSPDLKPPTGYEVATPRFFVDTVLGRAYTEDQYRSYLKQQLMSDHDINYFLNSFRTSAANWDKSPNNPSNFGKSPDELADQMIAQKKAKDELAAGLYQTTDPNIIGYSPSEPSITALPQAQETPLTPTEDALTPEIPSNNVLDQWKAHAEATQAMKGKTGLAAIPEYGFQTGYDFQSKFPNLDPRIGAGLASGYQVLTEGLGMFNPNNPNFLNPAAAYKTALSDATKNIEGIMAFDQNLMTPQQQENRNKYLKSVGQDIVKRQLPYMDQYQQDYQTRISQVDPNALRNRYLQNLQNTSSQDVNQFQSQLRSNLVPRENQPQGLDYLTGL